MHPSEKRTETSSLPQLLMGAGVGAALMYFLDPEHGKRRRALARDRLTSGMSKSTQTAGMIWRDLQQRLQGTAAEVRSWLAPGLVSDEILVQRVRSRMGHYVMRPSSINVSAHEGHVTLSGVILAGEERALISAVQAVRGVRSVSSVLNVERSRGRNAGLHGNGRRAAQSRDVMQRSWSPTTRLVAGTTGFALMANCLSRRTVEAALLGTFGFGLFLRALTNRETKRLFGVDAARRGINLEKTITIQAPVDAVYSLLADMENYPRFAESVRVVRKVADDRYQEQVRGPAGTEITLDVVMTRSIPNQLLAWRSGPDSDVKFAGLAQFETTSDGGTRVATKLTYNPPGGILTHSAARLARLDPKAFLDDLALRAKSFLETGRRPRGATEQRSPEIPYRRS